MVADGQVDVMITDRVEAMRYAKDNAELYAALADQPFTKNQFGYMLQQNEPAFANFINLWMEEMYLRGEFDRLFKKWIE